MVRFCNLLPFIWEENFFEETRVFATTIEPVGRLFERKSLTLFYVSEGIVFF